MRSGVGRYFEQEGAHDPFAQDRPAVRRPPAGHLARRRAVRSARIDAILDLIDRCLAENPPLGPSCPKAPPAPVTPIKPD